MTPRSPWQAVFADLARIRRHNIEGATRVRNGTSDAIGRFSTMEKRIRTAALETRRILDAMREKIALQVVRLPAEPDGAAHADAMAARYAALFRSVSEQLCLVTERKAEEIPRLMAIGALLGAAAEDGAAEDGAASGNPPGSQNADSLNDARRRIDAVVVEMAEAAAVEERLIHATLRVLEDVALSLVDAFVRVSAIVEQSLGESSSLGDEIAAIVVNLQCEDICQEMAEQTLSRLAAIRGNLRAAGFCEVDSVDSETASHMAPNKDSDKDSNKDSDKDSSRDSSKDSSRDSNKDLDMDSDDSAPDADVIYF